MDDLAKIKADLARMGVETEAGRILVVALARVLLRQAPAAYIAACAETRLSVGRPITAEELPLERGPGFYIPLAFYVALHQLDSRKG